MSLSRTPKRFKNRCVHALMLMWSRRPENGATLRWNSVMEKSSRSTHRSTRDP